MQELKENGKKQLDYTSLPLWSECEAALNRRYQHMVAEEASKPKTVQQAQSNPKKNGNRSFSFVAARNDSVQCMYCNSAEHQIGNCASFAALTVQQRFDFAKRAPLCINCLRKGHTVKKCKSNRCRVCNSSHHTLLHIYAPNTNLALPPPSQPTLMEESPSTSHVLHANASDRVILATAVVSVQTKSGEFVLARALLDSGSQLNFVTDELAQRIKITREDVCMSLRGIGGTNAQATKKIHTIVKSRIGNSQLSSDFWIMKNISGYHPDQAVNTSGWRVPENIQLADPFFFKPQKIDMLIGAETFFELLSIGQIKQGPEFPILQKTVLGWIVSGRCASENNKNAEKMVHLSCQEEALESIDTTLQKFWSVEDLPPKAKVHTPEQQLCQQHFEKNTQRLSSGRFSVRLPFKSDPNTLGSSYEVAKRRFLSLERKLSKDPSLKKMYIEFMEEYVSLGHMSSTNDKIPNTPHYFIPHQCVLRPQSTSTKLRVVFDASSRTSTQVALNDILMVGPTIQEELYSTLLRFRLHKFALAADVKKM
ncbi:uncharacterized protein LOC128261177 [Drosophila gunungcola]|uniref:uncharacterized protein LOC128261177 n=1 Tax=Drosophila gunungcola TaxID=103775 RepID=UPI0022E6BEC5|nr:uncharacterized protein LOC128261177 [Drosophila gunungcola]